MRDLFFVTLDPRRALGAGRLGMKVICLYTTDFLDAMRADDTDIFCLEEEVDEIPRDIESSGDLLEHPMVVRYLSGFSDAELTVFKPSKKLEMIAKAHGWKLLHPPARICRYLEDKVSFYELAQKHDLPVPRAEVLLWKQRTYTDISQSFGHRFVVQKRRGHAGSSTYIVDSEDAFENVLDPGTRVKVSEFLEGNTYTLNACVAANGELSIGYLWQQVTGVPSLSIGKTGTGGISPAGDLSALDRERIHVLTQRLGVVLHSLGYFGFFGIDLMMKNGEPLLIECNPRLTASVGFETALFLDSGVKPLLALHVGVDVPDSGDMGDTSNFSQLVVHNPSTHERKISHRLQSGVYGFEGSWKRISDLCSPGEIGDDRILLLTRNKGSRISATSDYASVIVPGSAYDSEDTVNDRILDFVERVVLGYDIRPRELRFDRYGRISRDLDVLQRPFLHWNDLSKKAMDRLRQTQLFAGEVVRLLGSAKGSHLVEKYDGTRGWIPDTVDQNQEATETEFLEQQHTTRELGEDEFFREYDGSPYLWGGVSKNGIDCSGFVQRYFHEVKGKIIPKHSRDQWNLGNAVSEEELQDGDIVLMESREKHVPHVGIWRKSGIYSACLSKKRVLWRSPQDIRKDYHLMGCRRPD